MNDPIVKKTTPKIAVESLCKSFDGERVLDGIDFAIPDSSSVVLLGESGSGKTLTFKCIMGLEHPDSGPGRADDDDDLQQSLETGRRESHVLRQ